MFPALFESLRSALRSFGSNSTVVSRVRRARIERLEDRVLLAQTHWVDGSVSQSGDGDTELTAFKTISEAALVAAAGDTIRILGGTYREEVSPPSGTQADPIHIIADDPVNDPVVVSGFDWLNSAGQFTQTSFNSSIYEIDLPTDFAKAPDANETTDTAVARIAGRNQLFVDGQVMQWARTQASGAAPATNLWANEYWEIGPNSLPPQLLPGAPFDNQSSSTSDDIATWDVTITDSRFTTGSGASKYVDAYIHLLVGRGEGGDGVGGEYLFQSAKIESAPAANQIRFRLKQVDGEDHFMPAEGNRFFITGDLDTLDRQGEWYRDGDTLYVWPLASQNINSDSVEMKARDWAFELSGKQHIRIEGINLFGAGVNMSASSSNIVIDDMLAQYVSHFSLAGLPGEYDSNGVALNESTWGITPGGEGIVLAGTDNTLQNSEIAWSAGNGITVEGSGHRIINNTIRDVNCAGTDAAAIYTRGGTENIEIAYNTITSSGRGLIVIRDAQQASIHHNDLSHATRKTRDGGAIYSFNTWAEGTVIAYNAIHDVYAFGDENNQASSDVAAGIYLDNGTGNYVIHHNVVWDSFYAIHLNTDSAAAKDLQSRGARGQHHKVYANTFVGTNKALRSGGDTDLIADSIVGTEFKNNILVGESYDGRLNDAIDVSNLWLKNDEANQYAADIAAARFVDYAAGDLRLRADSPARSHGNPSAPYTAGAAAKPDAGALEFGREGLVAGAGVIDSAAEIAAILKGYAQPIAAGPGAKRIEAEHYDTLGPGVSYYDSSVGNENSSSGGLRPAEGVDVNSTGNIGYISRGEWLEFTIDLALGGKYDLTVRTSKVNAAAAVTNDIEVLVGDGETFVSKGSIDLPEIASGEGASWGIDQSTTLAGIELAGGPQVIRLQVPDIDPRGAFNLDYFELTPKQNAYDRPNTTTGAPHIVNATGATTIQAEDYDTGGPGTSFSDTTSGNAYQSGGNGDRTINAVDTNVGGYIGHIAATEWLEYSVDPVLGGDFTVSLLTSVVNNIPVASRPNGDIAVLVGDGTNFTSYGSITLATNTSGTDDYSLTQVSPSLDIQLTGGPQVIRLVVQDGSGNFNFSSFTLQQRQSAYGTSGAVPRAIAASGTTTIQAEAYDNGGINVAYYDTTSGAGELTTPAHRGGGAVDLSPDSLKIGWIAPEEWLEYTVDPEIGGAYELTFYTSLTNGATDLPWDIEVWAGDGYTFESAGRVDIELSPSSPTGYAIEATGTASLIVGLHAEPQVLQLKVNGDTQGGQFNFDRFTVRPLQTAYAATATNLKVEADDFDSWDDGNSSGQGTAYSDTTSSNLISGGVRSGEGVDASPTGVVGYIAAGEWLEFTIDVATAGTFEFVAYGNNPSGNTTAPEMAAWTGDGLTLDRQLTTVDVTTTALGNNYGANAFNLEAGLQTIRIQMLTGGFNLDWFQFVAA